MPWRTYPQGPFGVGSWRWMFQHQDVAEAIRSVRQQDPKRSMLVFFLLFWRFEGIGEQSCKNDTKKITVYIRIYTYVYIFHYSHMFTNTGKHVHHEHFLVSWTASFASSCGATLQVVTHFERFLRYVEADHVFSSQNWHPWKVFTYCCCFFCCNIRLDPQPTDLPRRCNVIWAEACDVSGAYPEKWWQRTGR